LLKEYYGQAIGAIQQANSNMLSIAHDAFLSWWDWTYLSNPADNPNAVLDTHHYEGSVTILHYLIHSFWHRFQVT